MANKLINEQSPYLLQHAGNPVDWYPWGDEAFEKATLEHKPLIVSIGYAACHWCHVMEHESFEDEAVARYMNDHFVCIKVDREEHPDVDHMYMDAVQAIGGSGGWPLNVFVTPERAPFYGGTYYPPRPAYNRPSWMQLLQRMNEVWHQQPGEVALQAEQLITHLRQASQGALTGVAGALDKDICRAIADNLLKQADKEKGGFGNAPKFPGTMAIGFLLEHYYFTKCQPALHHALHSLDCMISGGIYDQLGGGFARYATDRNWLVPHFEKMLYDNALLITAMCDAYSITGDLRYKTVIEETIDFVERELKDDSGCYYCALDADSEGEEGKFYTWTWDEWIEALDENDEAAERYFGISRVGNWEGTNILHRAQEIDAIAAHLALSAEEVKNRIDSVKNRLLHVRGKRVRPATDDKCLLSWNALMNIGLCRAATAFAATDQVLSARYASAATAHMERLIQLFERDGILMHTWKDGIAKIPAKLDDYAYLAQALLQLASLTGDNHHVTRAARLIGHVVARFSRDDGFFYFTPDNQADIPVRKVDVYDGATPSANTVMAHNLWLCGLCLEKSEWRDRAWLMLRNMSETTSRHSYSFSYWAILLQKYLNDFKTVICSGVNAGVLQQEILQHYLPGTYILTSKKEISELPIFEKKFFGDKIVIFVCKEDACLSPVSSVDAALHLLAHA